MKIIIFLLIFSGILTISTMGLVEAALVPIAPTDLANSCGPSNPDCRDTPLDENALLIFDQTPDGYFLGSHHYDLWIDKDGVNYQTEIFARILTDGTCQTGTFQGAAIYENGSIVGYASHTSDCSGVITVEELETDHYEITFSMQNVTPGEHSINIDLIKMESGQGHLTGTYTIQVGEIQPIAEPIIHPSSPCDDGCTHEGNNPDLKIFASGYVENPIIGVNTISLVWKDPDGVVVYDSTIQVNAQGQFSNEFDNPMYVRDMRDTGSYTTTYQYYDVVLEYTWNYLTSVYDPIPQDGVIDLPCSMQEAGDGVSAGSCHGFYENGFARAEVGINYHSGLFPIQNYDAVGFFIDDIGNQGSNISVTHSIINPGESATLIFENSVTGFVSEFQMQMLGGDLVIDEPDTIPPVVVVPNNMARQVTSNNPSPVTFSVTATDDTDGTLTPECSQISGSNFQIGITTVTCTATDSAGNTNSKSFTITVTEVDIIELTIFVEEGIEIPGLGKTIQIKVMGAQQTVEIEIISISGEIIETLSFVASNEGEINQPWIIPKDTESGTYTAVVTDAFDSSSTTFEVDGNAPEPTPDPTPEPTEDRSDDQITLLGSIENFTQDSSTGVTWVLKSPENNIVSIGQVTPNSNGDFSVIRSLDNSLIKVEGYYIFDVHYGSSSDESIFEYEFEMGSVSTYVTLEGNGSQPTPEDEEFEILSFSTKKTQYRTGDTIVITGKVSTSDFSESVTLQVFKRGNLVDISQVTVSLNESFSHTVIAEGPLWKDDGKYTIKATYGEDSKDTSFVYRVSNSTPEPIPETDDEVTIVPVAGSGAPGCEETSQGCYLPSVVSVSAGGVVIMSNTDSAAHTFTAGTPGDGPTGEFDTGLLMANNSFEWTPDSEGVVPYFCMVHPWMLGTILVGEGTVPPPRPEPPSKDHIDLEISAENRVYDINTVVVLDISLSGITKSQNVAIDVTDPRGTTIISRSVMIDPNDEISFEFKIDENSKTGNYKVTATTSDGNRTVKDTTHFKVKSQFNSFKITSVQITDQKGNSSDLERGEIGFIKVNLESNKSIATLVTVNIFDLELTSIGIGSVQTTLASGNSEIILSFNIPDDAVPGPADIYVNTFSDWPSDGGIPLTKEASTTENIQ